MSDGQVSRRQWLFAAGGSAVGVAAGFGIAAAVGSGEGAVPSLSNPTESFSDAEMLRTPGASVPAAGGTQAGVARPVNPQSHTLVAVCTADAAAVRAGLPRLADLIEALTAPDAPHAAFPDGTGDLTITVGVGSRVLNSISAEASPMLTMPEFAGDAALDARYLGGDLLLSVSCSTATLLDTVLLELLACVPEAQLAWSQHGVRGPSHDTITRNPLGFHDGVIVPRGEAELDANVWITDGLFVGGTVCVIRRFRLDSGGFMALDVTEQERIMGRRKADGAPLSGGSLRDEVNLLSKTPAGEFEVPATSHVRAAHPSFTGSDLMLRRSYAITGEPGDLFVSFQRSIDTFVRTQLRLDETDALMAYVTPTATAAFLVLPGFGVGAGSSAWAKFA